MIDMMSSDSNGMLDEGEEWRKKERTILLRRLLDVERPENYTQRVKVIKYLEQEGLPSNDVDVETLASILRDDQLESLLMLTCTNSTAVFKGRYYTFSNGMLQHRGSWDIVRKDLTEFLNAHGRKGYALLKAMLEVDTDTIAGIMAKTSEVYGERLNPINMLIELRDGLRIAYSTSMDEGGRGNGEGKRGRHKTVWGILEEVRPLVRHMLDELCHIPRLSTRDAYMEFEYEVKRMDEELRTYLMQLIEERYEDTLRFGRDVTSEHIARYLRELFGSLYLDPLLAIAQQYSLTDSSIVSEKNHSKVMSTGFNLALFGDPGSGKTFAIKDLILGSENGVPAHGLPGMNRYCGGMTPAKFIAIGEAYEGRSVNFIITEFNDWFKYKGMVEPLKIAMERGIIRYETKSYSIRPYRFTSFFSVNYNTSVYNKNIYEPTIRDPNFKAVEDRMLCRLHILTKDRYGELAKRQSSLMKGILQERMSYTAGMIRDHLTLVYAIQRGYHNKDFKPKQIMINDGVVDKIRDVMDVIIEHIEDGSRYGEHRVPFSVRLEKKTLQLASTLALIRFFSYNDVITIDEHSLSIALRYLVEEAWIRSGYTFDVKSVTDILSIE
ncbi:conserved protein of unknown function [Candidatus Nitrosocaldus cavascurensis]|jgi:hypothetical protein|uniref:MCM domain-containing protein n=3 Tax=Candidatus Nitrosocaldus TaxID=498374 RepID=A0A2K5APT2_9ARCH|nr:conserved protein of unknown function [Candidatus Nitrosocaldus cavascurensis]